MCIHSLVCVCLDGTRAKCLSEEPQQEQENVYMEALAEFISGMASSDMNNFSALKQDKTAMLHETVLQVKALIDQGVCFTVSHLFNATNAVAAAAELLFIQFSVATTDHSQVNK